MDDNTLDVFDFMQNFDCQTAKRPRLIGFSLRSRTPTIAQSPGTLGLALRLGKYGWGRIS